MTRVKIVILLSPLVTLGALFLALRFGGLSVSRLLGWVKFLFPIGIFASIVLSALDSRYADAPMLVLLPLLVALLFMERRSKASG